jgi:hypothetical protein
MNELGHKVDAAHVFQQKKPAKLQAFVILDKRIY